MRPLSPTEERIIEGLREGLHDAELAVRLGITIGDLKQRITAMLREYRLLDRRALLDFEPPEPDATEPAPAPAPDRATGSRLRGPVLGTAAIALVVAVGTLSLLRPWEREQAAAPSAPATPDPAATPATVTLPRDLAPALTAGRTTVTFGHPISVDRTFALLLKAFDDENVTIGLDRVYQAPAAAKTVLEPLWRAPPGARVTGVAGGQLGAVAISYEIRDGAWLTTSADGGVTWSAPFPIERSRSPAFTGSFGTVLTPAAVGGGGFQLFDGEALAALQAPGNAVAGAPAGVGPADTLLWLADGGLLVDAAGQARIRPFTNNRPVSYISSLVWLPEQRTGAMVWRSGADTFTSILSFDGSTRETLSGMPGWLSGAAGVIRYIGTYCYYTTAAENFPWQPCLPVLFQPGLGTVHPINDPLLSARVFDPGTVVTSLAGPFALVRPGDACAPLYDSFDAPPVACAAPGTLLTLTHFSSFGVDGPEAPAYTVDDGRYYVRVLDPNGNRAWVEAPLVETAFPIPLVPPPPSQLPGSGASQ